MFYSMDKVQRGVARYIDDELIAKSDGKTKWIMTGVASLYIAKLPHLLHQIKDKGAVKILGIISEDGGVDIDSIAASIRPAAKKSPMEITLPFGGGTIRFTENDIDMLLDYISHA